MFDPVSAPRVFTTELGEDFTLSLYQGLLARTKDLPPDRLARVQVYVNTSRMQRRLKELFNAGPAALLPKIKLITEISNPSLLAKIPQAQNGFQQRLELFQLVSRFIENNPGIAPKSAAFDLSDSLANLLGEMHIEDVSPDKLPHLDVSDQSGHWVKTVEFINLVSGFFSCEIQMGSEARQRLVANEILSDWASTPPLDPIIIAGSTGSRKTTYDLMCAVSRLPQGAIILPGVDTTMPQVIWDELVRAVEGEKPLGEDHPQFRFIKFLRDLGYSKPMQNPWLETKIQAHPRVPLISLAMCPAPVTNFWSVEASNLTELDAACESVTWVEAPDERIEANVIALKLREVAENNKKAALITPDRNLSRRVSTALAQWGIIPDDSSGAPLSLTTPGRLLLKIGRLAFGKTEGKDLLGILKNPLVQRGSERNEHILLTRELEIWMRRHAVSNPDAEALHKWASGSDARTTWANWVCETFLVQWPEKEATSDQWWAFHKSVAEKAVAGYSDDPRDLWDKAAGRELAERLDSLTEFGAASGPVSAQEYLSIFAARIKDGTAREFDNPHPNILIWGTLEARVHGADLVILGGLNEATWPAQPAADPWLNRQLRKELGLMIPDRQIGLSAHDFQQAITVENTWVTRSIRKDGAETIPSRWLNRLENLLNGIATQTGENHCEGMKSRGNAWVDMAIEFERPIQARKEPRPSIAISPEFRPRELPITDFKHLIRDPYAIYAKRVLGLRKLSPLDEGPTAAMRGNVFHDVLRDFVDNFDHATLDTAKHVLLDMVQSALRKNLSWVASQKAWFAKAERHIDGFITGEMARQEWAVSHQLEHSLKSRIGPNGFTVTGKLDRIDLDGTGRATIFDYKTGTLPGKTEQQFFDKQLMLSALLVAKNMPKVALENATFLPFGTDKKPVDWAEDPGEFLTQFQEFLAAWTLGDSVYTARRALQKTTDTGQYDHLARFGEWSTADHPERVEII